MLLKFLSYCYQGKDLVSSSDSGSISSSRIKIMLEQLRITLLCRAAHLCRP